MSVLSEREVTYSLVRKGKPFKSITGPYQLSNARSWAELIDALIGVLHTEKTAAIGVARLCALVKGAVSP
jgi:hypothetical protein